MRDSPSVRSVTHASSRRIFQNNAMSALFYYLRHMFTIFKRKKNCDMLSGWVACVLISIIKLRLGFHKNHAGQGRLYMLCCIKIGIKSKFCHSLQFLKTRVPCAIETSLRRNQCNLMQLQ